MLAILGFPIYMIARYQAHLKSGKVYRIRTEPVDPFNPFLGRSVRLRIENEFDFPYADSLLKPGQTVYITLEKDSLGYDALTTLKTEVPSSEDYFQTQISRIFVSRTLSKSARVEIPFEYYYLNEQLAPAAEALLNNCCNDTLPDIYVQIRVLDGEPIMDDVFVGEQTIVEYLLEKKGMKE